MKLKFCIPSRALGAAFALFFLSSQAHSAQIIINIDSQSKLITASGSISGTTDNFADAFGGLAWNSFGSSSDFGQFSILSLLNVSGPAAPFSTNRAEWGTSGWDFVWDGGGILSSVTISATAASVDYSTWGASNIAALESTIGSTSGSLAWGTSSDSFLITGISAVPEPSSTIALGALLSLGMLMRRRTR
jgi:hypothetical protein